MIPSKKELLEELETMSYSERVKRMSLLGFREKNNVRLKYLLDELEGGSDYEITLSLYASIEAGYGDRLVKWIKSEANLIKNLASSVFFRVVKNDEFILREIANLPRDTRKRLLRKLYLYKKRDLAEKLFPLIRAEFGDVEALYVLPLCREKTVRKYLNERGDAIRFWRKLALNFPKAVLDYFERKLEVTPLKQQSVVWGKFAGIVDTLCRDYGGDLLDFAMKYCPENQIPSSLLRNFKILVKGEEERMFSLLTRPAFKSVLNQNLSYNYSYYSSGYEKILKNINYFKEEHIFHIAEILKDTPVAMQNLLKSLRPSFRGKVFDRAIKGMNLENQEWPYELLSVLPHDIRFREAKRMMSLRKIKDEPLRITELKAFCSITEVREDLYRDVRSADAEDRIRALKSLIKATGLCRKELSETLAYLERIKNEQDPVRQGVFSSLAEIRPSLFKEEHVEILERLSEFTFEARDTSYGTRQSLQKLALSLLCYNAKNPENRLFLSSLNILKKLAGQWGSLSLPGLESYLPAGTEQKIVDLLTPVIKAANERESYSLIITLARALGKRGWKIKKLQDMLFTVTKAKPDYTALQAINLWLECRETRGERVEKLLKEDKSVIVSPSVLSYIHYKKQNLLDYYISGKPVSGKFLTGKTVYVLPVRDGFYRWLPAQQSKFASIIKNVVEDEELNSSDRTYHMKILARIPVTAIEELSLYLKDGDVNIVEGALGAMVWLNKPGRALTVLTKYLDCDRARVAMYAIPRCLNFLTPPYVRDYLSSLLRREKLKITVYKEVLRLLCKFYVDRDCSILKNEWSKEELHRDVRIAVIHSAGRLPEAPGAWELLEEGVNSSDPDIVKSIVGLSCGSFSSEERERFIKLILKALENKNLIVRKNVFLKLLHLFHGMEKLIASAASKTVLNIENSPEWRYAFNVLLEIGREGKGKEEIFKTAKSLMEAPVRPGLNAGGERDLPHRQRLIQLLDSFVYFPHIERMRVASFISRLSDIITAPDLWPYRVALKLSSVSWNRADEIVETVKTLLKEMGSNIHMFNSINFQVTRPLNDNSLDLNKDVLLEVIDAFAEGIEEEQLIAVSLLKIAGHKRKWDENCCRRLKMLRNSSFISVKFNASCVWTSTE